VPQEEIGLIVREQSKDVSVLMGAVQHDHLFLFQRIYFVGSWTVDKEMKTSTMLNTLILSTLSSEDILTDKLNQTNISYSTRRALLKYNNSVSFNVNETTSPYYHLLHIGIDFITYLSIIRATTLKYFVTHCN
jgi:hypothetical protein